ncbi:serine/threonine protein kinase [Actinoplanes subglobosus]|uniref:non-specific serine/threonine protein kinase n=1 Tax=Actinoplanes subglobosus TaxID=1547892 RepID=A0ABV8J4S1_9ACTN
MPDAPVLLAGRYRLGESLGRGGMGRVFLARDETLQRDVAIKEIDQPLGADGAASARRTLREARAAARINHPNVIQVYDVLQLDDRTWIVMEYVPSRSLREEIAEQGPLDPYRVARIGLDLLGALRTAHRLGVEHRDVKPANVLLADDGRVLLTDFGIAAVDDDGVISRSDILVGSPQFMAPERAQGTRSGPEADLWSLGATLYAAIEGRSPYERGSTMATLAALATEEPDPPVHAGVLRPLLDGLLRKDPAVRITAEDAEGIARSVITDLTTPSEPAAPSRPSGLAGLAASIPAAFRIPRPRSSSERSTAARGEGAAARGEGAAARGERPAAAPGARTGSAAEAERAPDAERTPDAGPAPDAERAPDAGRGHGSGRRPDAGSGGNAGAAQSGGEGVKASTPSGTGSAAAAVPLGEQLPDASAEVGAPGELTAEPLPGSVLDASAAVHGGPEADPDSAGARSGTAPESDPAVADDVPEAGPTALTSADAAPDLMPEAIPAGVPDDSTPGATELDTRVGLSPTRRRGVLVAVAAVAVVLVAGVAWAVSGSPDGPEARPAVTGVAPSAGSVGGGTAAPSPSASVDAVQAPSSPSPSVNTSPSPDGDGRPQLPAGWVEYKDKTGFSLYVPAGWERSKEGTMVYFRGDGKILGIDQTDEPKSDPVKDWRNQSANRVAAGNFPQYREVRIEPVDYFLKAADWEFTFMRDGARRHVNNRGTVVASDKAYGIYWQTPDSEWSDSRDDLQLVFDSFRPAEG